MSFRAWREARPWSNQQLTGGHMDRRSGYSYVFDTWELIRWRGAVNSALKGKRGQAFLRELGEQMDAMPEKELYRGVFQGDGTTLCALGVVGEARGLDLDNTFEIEEYKGLSDRLDIAEAMTREIMEINDSPRGYESPGERWIRVRKWVNKQLEK